MTLTVVGMTTGDASIDLAESVLYLGFFQDMGYIERLYTPHKK